MVLFLLLIGLGTCTFSSATKEGLNAIELMMKGIGFIAMAVVMFVIYIIARISSKD